MLPKKDLEIFGECVEPMKESATAVFGQWEADIDIFTNPSMRARSAERLAETRGRYDAIASSVDSTSPTFESFNLNLRDHVLFLEHDFNPAAVTAIGGEVVSLTEQAGDLDGSLKSCLTTTLAYVRSTALPGELEVAQASKSATP